MKNFVFINIVVFIQFFLSANSRAIDKGVSVVYSFEDELAKYKNIKRIKWDEQIEDEVKVPENNIFKRLAFEDDEKFEAKLKQFEEIEDEEVVDEIPNEFPHEEDRLLKRSTISSSEYFRSQLSSFEKKVYDALYNISNKSKVSTLSFQLKDLKSSGVKSSYIKLYSSRGIGALVRDHPEFWWIKKYTVSMKNSGNYVNVLSVNIQSDYSLSDINTYKDKIKSRATSIANSANKKSNTYNKLLYIHDYLVKYIKYKDGSSYSYNLYGALIKNASACEGYAESFAYISRMINVPTICVTSNSHKWNYVYLKSKWYAVDVTFDDPTVSGKNYDVGDANNLSRKFFLIGKDTVVSKNKTYTTYSNRKLVSYIEFSNATGFKFPTLSSSKYTP